MKSKFLIAISVLIISLLITVGARPSYAYWNVFGVNIPSNGQEMKAIILSKVLGIESVNYSQNNNSQSPFGQSVPNEKDSIVSEKIPDTNANEVNKANDQNLSHIDLTERQINTLVYNFVTDRNLGGEFKVNDLKITLLEDSLEFVTELNNGVSLNGKVVTVDSGQSLKLVEINNTGSKSFFGLETVFVQTIFNKYANKESIAELVGNQYVDKFSHLEISPENLRVWFKNE